MKKIWVAYTDKNRVLAIASPSSIPSMLRKKESILNEWFYDQPSELESFLKQHPEKLKDVLKAISYWIIQKIEGLKENQNRYGTVKRELKKFDERLFKVLRAIAGRIAEQIKKFINPDPKKIKVVY